MRYSALSRAYEEHELAIKSGDLGAKEREWLDRMCKPGPGIKLVTQIYTALTRLVYPSVNMNNVRDASAKQGTIGKEICDGHCVRKIIVVFGSGVIALMSDTSTWVGRLRSVKPDTVKEFADLLAKEAPELTQICEGLLHSIVRPIVNGGLVASLNLESGTKLLPAIAGNCTFEWYCTSTLTAVVPQPHRPALSLDCLSKAEQRARRKRGSSAAIGKVQTSVSAGLSPSTDKETNTYKTRDDETRDD